MGRHEEQVNLWVEPARPREMTSTAPMYRDMLNSGNWVAEPKHNGWRCLASITDYIQCWSRHRKRIEVPDSVIRILAMVPRGTLLDGEFMKDTGTYIVWDCPVWRYKTSSNSLAARWVQLLNNVPQLGVCRLVQRIGKPDLKQMLADGHEGLVLKRIDSRYPHGQTVEWVKVKK